MKSRGKRQVESEDEQEEEEELKEEFAEEKIFNPVEKLLVSYN
jgi:hypothetical protein